MWAVSFTSPGLNDVVYTAAPDSVVARALAEAILKSMGIFNYHIKSVKRVNGG
jgi:hypothetical protein